MPAHMLRGPVSLTYVRYTPTSEERAEKKSLLSSSISSGDLKALSRLVNEEKRGNRNGSGELFVSLLDQAIEEGQRECVALLIQIFDSNSSDSPGKLSPLYHAVIKEKTSVARALLEAGANPNAENAYGNSLLSAACCKKNPALVQLLLEKGANHRLSLPNKGNLLEWACSLGYSEVVPVLIAHIGIEEIVRSTQSGAIQAAVARNDLELVKLLVEKGLSVHLPNAKGETPLHTAATFDKEEIASYLLEQGATAEAVDQEGRTPLYNACFKGNRSVAGLLLDHGASPGGTSPSPLTGACKGDHSFLIRMLLRKGAPVTRAAEVNTLLRSNLLPSFGEAIDEPYDQSLLTLLVGSPIDGVSLPIEKQVDVGARSRDGKTPLHLGAAQSPEVVVALLKRGADPRAVDQEGKTALTVAYEAKQEMCASLLFCYGCPISTHEEASFFASRGALSEDEDTALHLAARRGDSASVALLIEAEAPVQVENSNSFTPIDLASAHPRGPGSCFALLAEAGATLRREAEPFLLARELSDAGTSLDQLNEISGFSLDFLTLLVPLLGDKELAALRGTSRLMREGVDAVLAEHPKQ